MVAWNVYYDASRTQRDPTGVIMAAGLASTERKWLRFEREWKADLLQRHRIPYLHMKEFFIGEQFKHIKGKELEVLTDAAQIIKRRVHLSYTIGLLLEDFRVIDRTYMMTEAFRGPYAFVAGLCRDRMGTWLKEKHGNPPALHDMESGDVGQGALFNAVRKDPHLSFTVRDKVDLATGEWFVPFQASDFLAWVVRRVFEDHFAKKRLSPIAHMVARLLPMKNLIFNRDGLLAYCIMHPHLAPIRLQRWPRT